MTTIATGGLVTIAIAPIIPTISPICIAFPYLCAPALAVVAGAEIDASSSETIENLQVTGDISSVAEEFMM